MVWDCGWAMGERTGLGVLEVAALRATGGLSGARGGFVSSSEVLDVLGHEGLAPDYLYPVLQDLAVPWKRHLPLLEVQGNFGSSGNDPAADARYTEVRLSPIGLLALRSEDGEAGPVPLGLIDGTAYCGGRVPPFSPTSVTSTVSLLVTEGDAALTVPELDSLVGNPTVPTDAVIEGDLVPLLRGEASTFRMSCRTVVVREQGRTMLEIVGFPLGENVDRITDSIAERRRWPEQRRGGGTGIVVDVQDRSTARSGVRIHLVLGEGVDAADAARWLRTIWPVSVEVDWQLPAPMSERLLGAAAATRRSPGGLRELHALL